MCVAASGTVVSVTGRDAVVDFHGNQVTAKCGLTAVKPGDQVLVHAGCILQVLSQQEYDSKVLPYKRGDIVDAKGTKLAYSENGGADKDKVAVYSGLDITDPYILTMGGIYILTHKIDFDKLIIDNEYALKKIKDFDKYLSSVGVKNSRAEKFKISD